MLNSFAGSFAIGLCNRTAEQYIKGAPGVVVAEMAFHLQLSSEWESTPHLRAICRSGLANCTLNINYSLLEGRARDQKQAGLTLIQSMTLYCMRCSPQYSTNDQLKNISVPTAESVCDDLGPGILIFTLCFSSYKNVPHFSIIQFSQQHREIIITVFITFIHAICKLKKPVVCVLEAKCSVQDPKLEVAEVGLQLLFFCLQSNTFLNKNFLNTNTIQCTAGYLEGPLAHWFINYSSLYSGMVRPPITRF